MGRLDRSGYKRKSMDVWMWKSMVDRRIISLIWENRSGKCKASYVSISFVNLNTFLFNNRFISIKSTVTIVNSGLLQILDVLVSRIVSIGSRQHGIASLNFDRFEKEKAVIKHLTVTLII